MATISTEQISTQQGVFEAPFLGVTSLPEDEAIANHLSALSCSSSIASDPEFDLNLTPPGSPQLLCQNSGDFSMPSPIDSPGQVDEFGLDGSLNPQNSFWRDDLKTLEQGHVQKLVGDWDKRTSLIPGEELEPFDAKKENESRRSIVQPLIEYWESKDKEIVLVSCSGAPGHAQCTGSSLDLESRINCSHCSKPVDNKQDEELFSDFFKVDQLKESLSPSLPTLPLLSEELQYAPIVPDDSFEREPRFVNPKQYHRILKRRQQRAKYFQNHVVLKQTKPYKHETRHKHANSRPRGPGGRFMKRQTPKKASPEKEIPDASFDPFATDFFPSGALAA